MARHCGMGKDILRALKDAAMSRDEERLQFRTQQFIEHIGVKLADVGTVGILFALSINFVKSLSV